MSKKKINSHGSGPAINPEVLLLAFSVVAVGTIFYWTYSGAKEKRRQAAIATEVAAVPPAPLEEINENEVILSGDSLNLPTEDEWKAAAQKILEETPAEPPVPVEEEVKKEEVKKEISYTNYTPGSILPQKIHFGEKESEITAFSEKKIVEIVRLLEQNPHMRIRLIGHADPAEAKPALAEKRAKAAYNSLVEAGIAGNRLIVTHEGHDRPTVTNEAHVKNRRVEFEVVSN